uniref:Uncharacterized protein n=1 Tax=Cryptosporidium parvum TaxID=5807 RepID=F0X523_CRYPV
MSCVIVNPDLSLAIILGLYCRLIFCIQVVLST